MPGEKKKRKKEKKEEVFSGTAAEYFVAGELLRRGVNAFLSIGAHKQIDVLVRTKIGTMITIDVKAVHGPKPTTGRKTEVSWNMPKVEERALAPNFFYVLVWLGAEHGDYSTPEYFVIPAAWAGETCKRKHAEWSAGSTTRDAASTMRRLNYSDIGAWRDRWDLVIAAEIAMPHEDRARAEGSVPAI